MQFQVGDYVVHPVHGVGTIKTVSTQAFSAGQTRRYYEVATSGPTVWVPMDEQGATVLRGVAPRQVLRECRRLLSSDPVALNKNHQLRQLEIAARLKEGSLPSLCAAVRDLRARSAHTPLGAAEERMLRRLYKALCEEWAASEGVSAPAAEREIETLLKGGQESA